jgi:hypothetical protein
LRERPDDRLLQEANYPIKPSTAKVKKRGRKLPLLFDLQLRILKRIQHTEYRISNYRVTLQRLKSRLRSERLPKDQAASLKREIGTVHHKIEDCQWLLFVWRCFGDGIAFIYLDKWALKQLLYNKDDTDIKQGAGFITGKEGLETELDLLRQAKAAGVPCLLTDLTNSIRHGDVCLLVGPDPLLIEVKSSKNTNQRVGRQLNSLQALHNFFLTGQAAHWRGFPDVKRTELAVSEKNYLSILDDAIKSALTEGLYITDLEPGIRLIVGSKLQQPSYTMFAGLNKPLVAMLNMAKNQKAWYCYYPFTLSLRNPEHLYAFLSGDVVVIVAVDLSRLQSRAAELGFICTVPDEADYAFQFELPADSSGTPFIAQMSRHFANRIAFELLSWEWILNDLRLKSKHNDLAEISS